MKIIKIWADTHSSGIIDELGQSIDFQDTTISQKTWDDLQRWVSDYDYIIPLSQDERNIITKDISKLDSIGLDLLKRIRQEWKCDMKTGEVIQFVYFSEGLLKYLSVDGEIVVQ
jgi:hypothetical protein